MSSRCPGGASAHWPSSPSFWANQSRREWKLRWMAGSSSSWSSPVAAKIRSALAVALATASSAVISSRAPCSSRARPSGSVSASSRRPEAPRMPSTVARMVSGSGCCSVVVVPHGLSKTKTPPSGASITV